MTTAIVIGLLAVLVVSNAITWVVTRLRNGCDHGRHRHADSDGPPIFTGPPVVQDMPPSTEMDPADVTSPDIRWQVAP